MNKQARQILVEVLIYHSQRENSSCHCGWAVLGASWAEHIATVYEDALRFHSSEVE